MAERRSRPPRANAPFFMAGGEADFYGNQNDDDHSDGEDLFPSHSSHTQPNQQIEHDNYGGSAADAYRSIPTTEHHLNNNRFSVDLSSNVPASARPLLHPSQHNPGGTLPSSPVTPGMPMSMPTNGYSSSPNASRPTSYRLSYTGPPAPLTGNSINAGAGAGTPGGTGGRAFPPSAFVDPSAGQGIQETSASSYASHTMRRASTDEMGQRFGPAQRNSSLLSFAPPPAPWMRTESWHESQASLSTGVRNGGSPGTLTPRKRSALPSTLIKEPIEKPWLEKGDPWERASWWITVGLFIVGVLGSAVLCFFAYRDIPRLGRICPVMDDHFDGLDLSSKWSREVTLGGLRNGDFAMFTNNDKNSYASNGKLFIVPTLTRDEIGDQVFSGGRYSLEGCTSNNASACNARSDGNEKVINPVQSARLTTQNTYNIKYGRVEIRARLPKGDWLKPQIQMLPQDNVYGLYPVNGEIDIMQARGNSGDYPKQGRNFVTSGLHWAPTHSPNMDQFYKTYGWRSMRRGDFSDDYHTYVLEWSPDFMWTNRFTRGGISHRPC
ncbi:hypothetical protein FRB91_011226 [Serendipita sp. 411]|nr:hypothetical protein FRB91_011226 [Serendipita sp. 411]